MTSQESTDTTQTTPSPGEQDAAAQKPASAPEQGAQATADATGQKNESADRSTPEALLAAAKAEAAAHYERYVRAVADHENFRKRTTREKDELRQYAASRVLEDLLPVLDNLGLGLAAARQPNAEIKTLVDGVEMVQTQLKNALAQHGLVEINPQGVVFDAHQHEAISHIPDAKVPEGSVISVVRTGYSLNGRLLRPAAVVVSSGRPPEAAKTKA